MKRLDKIEAKARYYAYRGEEDMDTLWLIARLREAVALLEDVDVPQKYQPPPARDEWADDLEWTARRDALLDLLNEEVIRAALEDEG